MTRSDLTQLSCKGCTGDMPALKQPEIDKLMHQLDGWQQYDRLIRKTYRFKDYYQTMAFVNAVAWLSHREDHHPEMSVSYKECQVEYTTHIIHGLSENDFICAAKVEALFQS